jgi:hypothetical protein
MSDSTESPPWLLLIHQLPPKPDYVRVKVRRRLQGLGAVALKSTVYVLSNRPETVEDFEWLRGEIEADGGDATLCAAHLVGGLSDDEVEALFRAGREADYAEIARAARSAAAEAADPASARAEVARLRRRIDDVVRVDFFDAGGRADAERAIDDLETQANEGAGREGSTTRAGPGAAGAVAGVRGRTWVTREDIFVDRIASAWLIRRFIDPAATFKFVRPRAYRPQPGELRFDMYRGEYTHEADRCTFETLLGRFGLGGDRALTAIAEIVHDIDLKDEKFGRAEAAGVALVLGGIRRAHPNDADRLAHGATLFDGLYAQLGGGARV